MCTPTKWTYKVQAYNDQTGCEVIMLVLNKENIFHRKNIWIVFTIIVYS